MPVVLMYPALGSPPLFTLATETYPVDLQGSCTGAWSNRKLASGYSGSVLKARRTSDSVTYDLPWHPTVSFVGDFAALNTFLAGQDATYDTWYDQSGNARNQARATTSAQPRLVTGNAYRTLASGYPGMECVEHENLESAVATSSFFSTTGGTIVAVVLADTTTGLTVPAGRAVCGNYGGNAGLLFQNGVQAVAMQYSAGYQSVAYTGLSTATAYVVVWRHLSGVLSCFVNSGTPVTVSAPTGDVLSAAFWIGQMQPSSGWDGLLMEVLTWGTGLSDAEVAIIGAACASPYGITWS